MPAAAKPSFDLEKDLLCKGVTCIAGVDEAGRGALAGPLSLGLVIFDPAFIASSSPDELACINDSKKLSPRKRIRACGMIRTTSLFAGWTMVSHRIIDRLNINGATEYALIKLLQSIPVTPDIVLMDGNFRFSCGIPVLPVTKGDSLSISIAAASIMAKVNRDSAMVKLNGFFPGYGIDRNKGYGTRAHMTALRNIGFSPIHRRSYDPVKTMVNEAENEDRTGE